MTLDHLSLIVADTERSLRFYRDFLGLEQLPRPALAFQGAWLDLGGGVALHLMELSNPDPVVGRPEHGGRDRHIALSVDDFTRLQQRLISAGYTISMSKSGRPALFCRDPDGNGIELLAK